MTSDLPQKDASQPKALHGKYYHCLHARNTPELQSHIYYKMISNLYDIWRMRNKAGMFILV